MKTVFINLKEDNIISSQKIFVNSIIKLDSSFVDMANHLNEDELGVLIQLEHNQTVAILNLTDVTPYVLLFFDDELDFKGSTDSFKSGTGSFTIQTQYKNILFVRIPHNLKLNKIINLRLEEHHDTEDERYKNILTVTTPHSNPEDKRYTLRQFIPGYGQFPYAILRNKGHGSYMQIPIHFNTNYDDNCPGTNIEDISNVILEKYEADKLSELHDVMIERCIWMKNKTEADRNKTFEMWLVEGPELAYYFEGDTIKHITNIPSGGTLVTQGLRILAMNVKHYL